MNRPGACTEPSDPHRSHAPAIFGQGEETSLPVVLDEGQFQFPAHGCSAHVIRISKHVSSVDNLDVDTV